MRTLKIHNENIMWGEAQTIPAATKRVVASHRRHYVRQGVAFTSKSRDWIIRPQLGNTHSDHEDHQQILFTNLLGNRNCCQDDGSWKYLTSCPTVLKHNRCPDLHAWGGGFGESERRGVMTVEFYWKQHFGEERSRKYLTSCQLVHRHSLLSCGRP